MGKKVCRHASLLSTARPSTLKKLMGEDERCGAGVRCSAFKVATVPRYLIYREIPEAGGLTAEDLQGISPSHREVLRGMGPEIQWVQSYVTPGRDHVRLHRAERGDDPHARISRRLPGNAHL